MIFEFTNKSKTNFANPLKPGFSSKSTSKITKILKNIKQNQHLKPLNSNNHNSSSQTTIHLLSQKIDSLSTLPQIHKYFLTRLKQSKAIHSHESDIKSLYKSLNSSPSNLQYLSFFSSLHSSNLTKHNQRDNQSEKVIAIKELFRKARNQ